MTFQQNPTQTDTSCRFSTGMKTKLSNMTHGQIIHPVYKITKILALHMAAISAKVSTRNQLVQTRKMVRKVTMPMVWSSTNFAMMQGHLTPVPVDLSDSRNFAEVPSVLIRRSSSSSFFSGFGGAGDSDGREWRLGNSRSRKMCQQ